LPSPPESLRQRAEFVRAQSEGKKLKGRHLLVIVAAGRTGGVRLGITVSRRVGNAVVRNRVRRRIREIVRGQLALLPRGFDLIVIAFPEAARAPFAVLNEELPCLLTRARDWVSSRSSS
jgi:ribonuclease P protein component